MLKILKGGKCFFFCVLFAEAAWRPHLAAPVLELGVAMGYREGKEGGKGQLIKTESKDTFCR